MEYENQLLELMKQDKNSGEPFYLDFFKSSHRKNFYERYGGEETLKKEFPDLYELVQRTAAKTGEQAKFTEKNGILEDQRGSLEDGIKIRELVCTGNEAWASGLVSLCQKTPRIYMSLSILKNGMVIKRNRKFYHNESTAILDCIAEEIESVLGDDLECVMNVTWEDASTNLLKDCSRAMRARISEEETVSELRVYHPCLYHPCIRPYSSVPMPELSMIEESAQGRQPLELPREVDDEKRRSSINVCYARTPGGRDVSDYVYPEGRVGYWQKTYLDFRGEVVLNQEAGYTFRSVEGVDILLDCVGDGVILYKAAIKEGVHYYATEKGFAFALPTYWKAQISESVMFGNRLYYLEAEICFKINESEEEQYVSISSRDGISLKDTRYSTIKPIRLFWGCLAEGTKVRMADGSERKIEEIKEKDIVRTPSDQAVVTEVFQGWDSEIYAISAKGCPEILASGAHPFRTENGWKIAREITGLDKLMTESGAAEVEHHYLVEQNIKVYNLILDEDHSFYADGYETGDNEVQGSCQRRKVKKEEVNQDIVRECEKLERMFGGEKD